MMDVLNTIKHIRWEDSNSYVALNYQLSITYHPLCISYKLNISYYLIVVSYVGLTNPCIRFISSLRTLTLSQWSSSGNPVAIQCAWNLDPSVYWNATGEINVGSQLISIVFPVVFQCAPIMQINTGTPLGASISQCGSSGIPVYLCLQWSSNYAN